MGGRLIWLKSHVRVGFSSSTAELPGPIVRELRVQKSFHSFETNLSLLLSVHDPTRIHSLTHTHTHTSIAPPQHKNWCQDHYVNYKVTELHTLAQQLHLHLNMTVPSSISHINHKVSLRYQGSGCKYQTCICCLIRVNTLT
jgi:hypothetical protein